MPTPSLTLWIDIATGKLTSGWQSISYAPNPVLKQGDSLGVELHLINNFNGGSFSEYEFSPSTALTLAIGKIDTPPVSGTYRLTYGADTTSAISADATALNVQTALNALASIASEGGVTVNKTTNSLRIIWNTATTTTNVLSYSLNELFPSSSIGISKVKTGSVSPTQKQIYQVHVKQSPVANITSFVNQDAPAISVSQIHAPLFVGDTKVWRISILPQPKSGSFLINFNNGSTGYTTSPIDISASAESVRTRLSTAYDAGWSVTKSGTNQWDISTTVSSTSNVVASDAGVIGFNSKYGILNLNTAEVEDMIGGEVSALATLEVQLETNGTKTTIIQQDVTVLNDLIDDASYDIVQWGTYIPADSVIRYDTSQALSPSQKIQAKQNIGVVDIDTTTLVAKDVELEGRIGDLELIVLSTNQFDAIDGSDLPSSTNVFITESALSDELALKANISHTHSISEVDGLSLALNDKSDVGHSHIVSEVNGLSEAISGKADTTTVNTSLLGKSNIDHTHTSFTTLSVSALTTTGTLTVSNIQITSGSTGDPWGYPAIIEEVGNPPDPLVVVPSGVYPLEIPIKISGVTYLIPARIFT